jgi:hypothetical protein
MRKISWEYNGAIPLNSWENWELTIKNDGIMNENIMGFNG